MATIGYIKKLEASDEQKYKKEITKQFKVDNFICEFYSIYNSERRDLLNLINELNDKDTLVVYELNHLASTLEELINLLDIARKKNITLISLKEKIDTSIKELNIPLQTIYNLWEFEKANNRDLQKIGIIRAKGEKRYKGRIPTSYKDLKEFERYYFDYKYKRITKKKMAECLGVSRPTLDKVLREYTK